MKKYKLLQEVVITEQEYDKYGEMIVNAVWVIAWIKKEQNTSLPSYEYSYFVNGQWMRERDIFLSESIVQNL